MKTGEKRFYGGFGCLSHGRQGPDKNRCISIARGVLATSENVPSEYFSFVSNPRKKPKEAASMSPKIAIVAGILTFETVYIFFQISHTPAIYFV